MAYRADTADEATMDAAFDWEAAEEELSAIDYSRIPYIARRWLWPGYVPIGAPTIWAAAGETGKGMLFCLVTARVVLGLPFPNEHPEVRRAPARVVWISGDGEDDQFEDLAPRLRAAIAHAVDEFGLDPELAGEGPRGAINLVHDLSQWRDGEGVTLPADCPRILTELKAIEKRHGGPPVGLLVADSLSALLSDRYTIDSRQGARRVNGKLSRFARMADIAVCIIHHLTKDGKVAGSPAVLDSLRLGFVIVRDEANPDNRVITRRKANISAALPQQYTVTGEGPATHAEFVSAADARTERVAKAARSDAAGMTSVGLHERVADAAGPVAGPWRVLMQETSPSGTVLRHPLGQEGDREVARSLAANDAGTVLRWELRQGSAVPHMSVAEHTRADGSKVRYACFPVGAGDAARM